MKKKPEIDIAEVPALVFRHKHGDLRVYESPARRRAVQVREYKVKPPKLKTVQAPRLVFLMRSNATVLVMEAEDDGAPLSLGTAVNMCGGRIGNILVYNRVCFGNTPRSLVKLRPVSTFWNTRFDYFRDASPSKRFGLTLGDCPAESLNLKIVSDILR